MFFKSWYDGNFFSRLRDRIKRGSVKRNYPRKNAVRKAPVQMQVAKYSTPKRLNYNRDIEVANGALIERLDYNRVPKRLRGRLDDEGNLADWKKDPVESYMRGHKRLTDGLVKAGSYLEPIVGVGANLANEFSNELYQLGIDVAGRDPYSKRKSKRGKHN